jgi:hypothetical protein
LGAPGAAKKEKMNLNSSSSLLAIPLGLLLLLASAAPGQAQFLYSLNGDNTVTITGYRGPNGSVSIPPSINGISVTGIGTYAFFGFTYLTSITIPASVNSIGFQAFCLCDGLTNVTIAGSVTIGMQAFNACTSLTSIYVSGNAPLADPTAFSGPDGYGYDPATICYLPGTVGWPQFFSQQVGLSAKLWLLANPLILDLPPNFGIKTNQFGFVVSWATNASVVVEACTNLSNPIWTPLLTNTLTNGWFYFSEPLQTINSGRFYQIAVP